MPGSTPATSQLDWLISTTAITVLSWSRATRDLLKSFVWGIRALHQLDAATMVPSPRRLPHTMSPLEEDGFEPSVPQKGGQWFFETAPFNRAGLSWPRKLVAAAFQPDPLPPTKSPSPEGRSSRGAPAFFRPFCRRTNDREPAEKGVPHRTPRARTTSSKSGTSCHPAIRIFDEASYSQF